MATQQREYPVSTLEVLGQRPAGLAHVTRTPLGKALLSRTSADNPEN